MGKNTLPLLILTIIGIFAGIFFAEILIFNKIAAVIFWVVSFIVGLSFHSFCFQEEKKIDCNRWSMINAVGIGIFLGGLPVWLYEMSSGSPLPFVSIQAGEYWLKGLLVFASTFLFFLGAVTFEIYAKIKGTWDVIKNWE